MKTFILSKIILLNAKQYGKFTGLFQSWINEDLSNNEQTVFHLPELKYGEYGIFAESLLRELIVHPTNNTAEEYTKRGSNFGQASIDKVCRPWLDCDDMKNIEVVSIRIYEARQ